VLPERLKRQSAVRGGPFPYFVIIPFKQTMNLNRKLVFQYAFPLLLNGGFFLVAIALISTAHDGWSAVGFVLLVLVAGFITNVGFLIKSVLRRNYVLALVYLVIIVVIVLVYQETDMPGKIGG
jgi:hypothetical protein